jgi:hypothetical protein
VVVVLGLALGLAVAFLGTAFDRLGAPTAQAVESVADAQTPSAGVSAGPVAGPAPAREPAGAAPVLQGPAPGPIQPALPKPDEKSGAERKKPAEPRPDPTTWHATVFFSSSSQYRIIHYWSSGSSMRAETVIRGHPITTLVHDGRYVAMDRLSGKARDVERSERAVAEDAKRPRPFGIEPDEIRAAGAEKIEETKLSGVAAEVWRVSDDAGRRTVWVSKAPPHVPLRAETFVRGSSDTIIFDYSNWAFDLPMPESFFEVPSNVDVESLDYDEYMEQSAKGPVGPAPILYPDLLHGSKP